ncbi:MAG TPA: hypothetical protein VI408_07885 [Gaiellaceae bacterium]
MRRHRVDIIVLFVLASAGCAFWAFAVPGQRPLVLHVWVLTVGGLLMLGGVSAVGAAVPPRRRSELSRALSAREAPPQPVSQLAKLEREVTLAVGNAYDLHARLLPQLREIASARLERRGLALAPDTAGRWWDLLRPDRAEPEDRFAPGIRESELRALVADLERM